MNGFNKKFLFYIVGFFLIVFGFTATVEVSTRIESKVSGKGFFLNVSEKEFYDSEVQDIYQFHPFTGFVFKPNISISSGHPGQREKPTILVDTNGFLGDGTNISFHKAKNEIRIATIGASTTASINLAYQENWPGRLRYLLQQVFPEKKITLLNAAIPGFDTSQSLGNLALRVMPFQPDIVIIYHAYNDLKTIRFDREFKPDYSHVHPVPFGFHEKPAWPKLLLEKSMLYVRLRSEYRAVVAQRKIVEAFYNSGRLQQVPHAAQEAFREHIQALVAVARSGGAEVVLSSFATLHDPSFEYDVPDTDTVSGDLKQLELLSIMHFTPGLSLDAIFEGIRTYNDQLAELASENDTYWVDNAGLVPHEERFFVDRVHFSAAGAAKMAENFLPEVARIVRQKVLPES
ncbi:MAG: SGNH/GDSL hydrolase family protein [Proteobacteria bacterium]|nr:SGNH/GDSL hydrolase family protein [Pseudomonadota bacterium]MBU1688301.1 SGNH/GDSL hydrolase family protein [Pseudomonadota bacterium]